ncbi:MAG: hypothetical protein IJ809_02145 [Clostridia bacterium]|nr:hypothetical protein [Clostridia bacterium]
MYISLKAGVPILPVRIIKEKPEKTFFTRVWVIYGNPIVLNKDKANDKEYLRKETNRMLEYIYSLEVPNSNEENSKKKVKASKIKIHIEE